MGGCIIHFKIFYHCRKIVEHVDWMTSAEQMAEYIKAFRYCKLAFVVTIFSSPERIYRKSYCTDP